MRTKHPAANGAPAHRPRGAGSSPGDAGATTIAESADERESRALSSVENADLCAGCVTCCTYVTIEVDAPRQAWEYDQWIWMLHHQGLEMYVEKPERWFVYVPTRCDQLNAEGRCGIHGRHPVLCRDYDPRSCERRYPLSDTRAWFHDAAELETWMQQHRPVHWQRLLAYRGAMPDGPPKARGRGTGVAGALVQISGFGNGAGSREPAPVHARAGRASSARRPEKAGR